MTNLVIIKDIIKPNEYYYLIFSIEINDKVFYNKKT